MFAAVLNGGSLTEEPIIENNGENDERVSITVSDLDPVFPRHMFIMEKTRETKKGYITFKTAAAAMTRQYFPHFSHAPYSHLAKVHARHHSLHPRRNTSESYQCAILHHL